MPQGTIKATVLIETILAAFEMDEILHELREHSAGLNAGRWDYIFSVIKKLGHRPEFVLPDRAAVTMAVPFMRAYCELLVKTCHRRGAHAMGGMAAFIPSRRDPEVNAVALEKVREDKDREASQGFDGTWVAHPDLVPVAMESFDRVLGDRPNQIERQRDDVEVACGRPARRRRDARRRHRGGSPQQRLGRDPVPRRLAARLGRGRDQQPHGGRGDRGDLPLPDLAVAPPRPRRRRRTCAGSPTRRSRSSARTTTTRARIFERIATAARLRRVPHAAGVRPARRDRRSLSRGTRDRVRGRVGVVPEDAVAARARATLVRCGSRGTRFGIQDCSPITTSVGHSGHGGAGDAISLQAAITAGARNASASGRPRPGRGTRRPPPRASRAAS